MFVNEEERGLLVRKSFGGENMKERAQGEVIIADQARGLLSLSLL